MSLVVDLLTWKVSRQKLMNQKLEPRELEEFERLVGEVKRSQRRRKKRSRA